MHDPRTRQVVGEELATWHRALDEHFLRLRAARDEKSPGKLLFALEHGLSASEVTELQELFREAIALGRPPRGVWLPSVIYAAEFGYRYCGDEYWQTFEVETPGWRDHVERAYVRNAFEEFHKLYGGAKPTGRWAQQFSIIAWPITHAVLPTDLQVQLARLLYEYRHALSAELVEDYSALGYKLAARARGYTSRFQNFAQNTALLGQVAAALLLPQEAQASLLLRPTLERIVADLNAERHAKRWLQDARRNVDLVTRRGFGRHEQTRSNRTINTERSARLADPRLSLRRDGRDWTVRLELPDLTPLGQRFPDLLASLATMRCRVAGVGGAPLAPGRVLTPHP